jgi:bifunctional DNase/RNase
MALVPARVRGLVMENPSKTPIVVLQEEDGERVLPIWIGEAEARAIGLALAKETLERPLTHDLLLLLVKGLGAKVTAVSITGLEENTYFAEIQLTTPDGKTVLVDARPSDSIALALRAEASLFVADEVFEGGSPAGFRVEEREPSETEKRAELKKFLEELDPSDFGKFGI